MSRRLERLALYLAAVAALLMLGAAIYAFTGV
jgi:hypothetical protein